VTVLLSIDPGTHHYGLAEWHDGVLRSAWWVKKTDESYGIGHKVDEIVCEHPQVYMNNLKAANDMVTLGISAGEIVGRLYAEKVTYYRPSTWKGSISKEQHHPRVMAELSIYERECVELTKNKEHNLDIWDAVGLGLFYLKRMGRGKK
jgi:hypothetical protein